MRLLFRFLQMAFPIVCAVACAITFILWVRSYWSGDMLYLRPTSATMYIVRSAEGQLSFGNWSRRLATMGNPPPIGFTRKQFAIADDSELRNTWLPGRIFRGFNGPSRFGYRLPSWFLVLMLAAFSGFHRLIRRAKQFSVQTLLIATTIIAILLGLVVYFGH